MDGVFIILGGRKNASMGYLDVFPTIINIGYSPESWEWFRGKKSKFSGYMVGSF